MVQITLFPGFGNRNLPPRTEMQTQRAELRTQGRGRGARTESSAGTDAPVCGV